jgi:fucose permease
MRTHKAVNTRTDQQRMLTPLMALLLMVVVPTLIVAMTRASGALPQFLLGLGVGLAIVAAGVYVYQLGKSA